MSGCLHITVKGRVQGVAFRANTRRQAMKMNIRGFVRNIPSGDVEILAIGEQESLQQLITWCHKGPLLAKVSDVIVNEHHSGEDFESFHIR